MRTIKIELRGIVYPKYWVIGYKDTVLVYQMDFKTLKAAKKAAKNFLKRG